MLLSFTSLSAQVFVDFEGVTKGSYATNTVAMGEYDWQFTEALIGVHANDWKVEERSARLRGHHNSELGMLTPKLGGMGTISFQYRRYGTDPQVDWKVEYTRDDGLTWTQAGDDFTAPDTDEVQMFSTEINKSGNIRMRIVRATNDSNETKDRRLNIDNITISNWSGSLSDFALAGAVLFYPGDILDFMWSAVGVSEIQFEVKFLDSDWEVVDDIGLVDATLGAFQLPIPMSAGDETIKIRIVDYFDNNTFSNEVNFTIIDNIFSGLDPEFGHYPESGETDVAIDLYFLKTGTDEHGDTWAWSSRGEIVINFDEDEVVANAGDITISKQGEPEPIHIFNVLTSDNIEVDRSTLTIALPANLESTTTYVVVLPAEAFADKAAVPNLSEEITWSFTTGTREGSDVFTGLNPHESLYPAENATDVFTNLYFYRSDTDENNEPWGWEMKHTIMLDFIDDVVLNSGYISIYKDAEPTPVYSFDVASANEVLISGRSVWITLPENLLPNTTYEVVIPQGVIVDTTNPVANEWEGITWSFTTSEGEGGFNPNFVLHPSDGALDLPTDLFLYHEGWNDFFFNSIILTLDENIAKGTGEIIITNLTDNVEAYSFDMTNEAVRIYNNKSVIVSLPDKLDVDVLYSIKVEPGAIIDAELPNRPWQGVTWTFNTGNRDSFRTIYEIRDQKSVPVFMGEYVPTSGVVIKKRSSGSFFFQDDDSQGWNGIFVNDPVFGATVVEGEEYNLVGKVGFENDMAQLSDVRISNRISKNQFLTPIVVNLPFVEEYLSMLVKITNVSAVDVPDATLEFWVSDGEKTGLISKLWYTYPVEKDQGFSSITGVLHRGVGKYKLAPRNADDLETIVVSSNAVKSVKLMVSFNPDTDILNILAPSEIEFVELVSIVGESLLKENGFNKTNISVSTAGLPQGVYLVKTALKNGEASVVKIIKN